MLDDLKYVSLFYFYINQNCQFCKDGEMLMNVVAEDNEGIFKVYHVDCEVLWEDSRTHSRFPICQPKYRTQLPQLTFWRVLPEGKAAETRFEGDATPASLSKFGHSLMPAQRERIETVEEYKAFEAANRLSKVVLFTEKKKTGALYKAISQLFYGRLYFAEVVESKESQALLDEFSVEELPQVYVVAEGKRVRYEGKLKIREMKEWLGQFAGEAVEVEYADAFDEIQELMEEKKKQHEQRKQEEEERRRREDEEKQEQEKQESEFGEVTEINWDIFNHVLLKNEKPALVLFESEDEPHSLWNLLRRKYK